ncbi:MAG: hypothetical protein WA851_16330 [Xanthobacteraceae bacterium]
MPSRQQVKIHINRALRARAVEQKLDEIALAIGELARYVEDIEKNKLSSSPMVAVRDQALRAPIAR